MRRFIPLTLVVALFGVLVGQASAAFDTSQAYQGDTLFNQPAGKAWSPIRGVLSGRGVWENGQKKSFAQASSHAWNDQAIQWMRNTSGTPSITFHIFDHFNKCSSWTSQSWAGTNLPGSTYSRPLRVCGYNEIRVQADKTRLVANQDYHAQVYFIDQAPRSRAKVVVDTYWNGDSNYHQHYCHLENSDVAWPRNSCG